MEFDEKIDEDYKLHEVEGYKIAIKKDILHWFISLQILKNNGEIK